MPQRVVKHIVQFKIRHLDEPERQAEVAAMSDALANLVGKVPGLIAYDSGFNISQEKVVGERSTWGFVMTFADESSLYAYAAPCPLHKAVIDRYIAPLLEGSDDVVVFDYVAESKV